MSFNKQVEKMVGVDEREYRKWCKENKEPIHKAESKTKFFARIQEGRLLKDSEGNIVRKRNKKNGAKDISEE